MMSCMGCNAENGFGRSARVICCDSGIMRMLRVVGWKSCGSCANRGAMLSGGAFMSGLICLRFLLRLTVVKPSWSE